MLCKECNTRNNYYNKICTNCGAKLERVTKEVKQSVEHQIPVLIVNKGHAMEKAQKRRAKKTMKKVLYVLGTILLLAIVALYFAYSYLGLFNTEEGLGETLNQKQALESYDVAGQPLFVQVISDDKMDKLTVEGEKGMLRLYSNAKSIEVNGVESKATANEYNEWFVEIPDIGYGESDVLIRAVGHKGDSIKESYEVFRKYPSLPIVLDAEQKLSTSLDEIEVTGTMPLGMDMIYESMLECDIRQNPNSKAFTITISMPDIPGDYPITLVATSDDYETKKLVFVVTKRLNIETYMQSVTRVSYDDIMDNLQEYENKSLIFTGVVDHVIETYPNKIFKFKMEGKKDQLVVLSKYGNSIAIKEGNEYVVYADFEGYEDLMPRFNVRYITNKIR